jgi:hypothetical protein
MKLLLRTALVMLLSLATSSAFAATLPTHQFSAEAERALLLDKVFQRQHLERQLIKLGVDAASANQRVGQMTDTEVAGLQGNLTELPAGAGTGLLLLIILIILLI